VRLRPIRADLFQGWLSNMLIHCQKDSGIASGALRLISGLLRKPASISDKPPEAVASATG
jgi:hypothetical protein